MIIDRFEGGIAICEGPDGQVHIDANLLEAGLAEGDVIRFDGARYVKEAGETARRRQLIQDKMAALKRFKP